jgi:hydroxyacid-oxoacid transhydrogenase
VTGIAIFDLVEAEVKTGIASRRLRPTLALIDPRFTLSLPSAVVACGGFAVLSHALESYTALPYTKRRASAATAARPMSQGANPFSDLACREALRLAGAYLQRAVADPHDEEARERMMYAATLAGIGFGNAGVQIPHAMSYAVAGLVRSYHAPGYPGSEAIVPHGMAVILNAPAAMRFTAPSDPARHLEAAELLGGYAGGASPPEAGEALAERIAELMRATSMPNGIGGVGFGNSDLPALRDGALAQQRLLANAPRPPGREELEGIFSSAMRYW